MLFKVLQKALLFLMLLLFSSFSYAQYKDCTSSFSITGLPTSAVGVTANTPKSWDVEIVGGAGYRADTYSLYWTTNPSQGMIEEEWLSRSGHTATVRITYTPNEDFNGTDNDVVRFKVLHAYGECLSNARKISMYEASCNGIFELTGDSYSTTMNSLKWGSVWLQYTYVKTVDPKEAPEYNVVPLGGLPNLGTFEHTSTSVYSPGHRITTKYVHSEVSSGSDTVRFRIEDNAIEDAAARESCGIVVEIPINIKTQPSHYYCSGLSADISVVPGIIDAGDEATITVQGIAGSKSSGDFTYEIINALTNGDIDSDDMEETSSTTGGMTYTYQHDGGTVDGRSYGDTVSIRIRDAVHTECSIVRNATISMINHCASLVATIPPVDPIDRGDLTTFTVNVVGGSGKYKFRVVSAVNNGDIVGHDNGYKETTSYTFNYQHDSDSYAGDTITIEIEDHDTECLYEVSVPIQLINHCDGFGIDTENSTTTLMIDPGGSDTATIFANAGNGSGNFIYSIYNEPSHGEVSPSSSGETIANSFDFFYEHDGSEFTDNFIVQVQDADYNECVQQVQVNVVFIDYCESFSWDINPQTQTINIGGSYSFTVTGLGGSGQYRYTITDGPVNGVITSSTDSGNVTGPFTFDYSHHPANVNDGDNIEVTIEDTTHGCSVERVVKMNMTNHCYNFNGRTTINNKTTNYYHQRNLNQVIPIDVTVTGGSGNYEFIFHGEGHHDWFTGTLTEIEEPSEPDAHTYIKHFTYVQDETRTTRISPKKGDRILVKVKDLTYKCESTWDETRYIFEGGDGNLACHNYTMNVSGVSTSKNDSNVGEVFEFTLTGNGVDVSRNYEFEITEQTTLGGNRVISIGEGTSAVSMKFRYTAPKNTEGDDYFTIALRDVDDASCAERSRRFRFDVEDSSDVCNFKASEADGHVIIDNTTSNVAAISTNLKFLNQCDKEETTIGDKPKGHKDKNGQGANTINIKDYQIVARHAEENNLQIHVGALHGDGVVESNKLYDTSRRLQYFTDGKHLFNLDDLRKTADWLKDNVSPRAADSDAGIKERAAGTYGTISMRQFLENIRDGKTMYGVVRVQIGLEKGACKGNPEDEHTYTCEESAYNGLGVPVHEETLYGFCGDDTVTGLCSCAPSSRTGRTVANHFDNIKPGATLCGDIVLPEDAKILVKGALLWDFVSYNELGEDGKPKTIELKYLPFFPRELYFMVDIPIVINSAYENDYASGSLISEEFKSQVEYIRDITKNKSSGAHSFADFDFANVSQASRNFYKFKTGEELTEEKYHELAIADQYHLLMPSGYAAGWAEAFKHLEVTAAQWKALEFEVPPEDTEDFDINQPLSEKWMHDDRTQDVPVYLYSGGLVDMHSHVNVSGLVYVPQALELEAEVGSGIRQMIMGALVVKDGFFIKAKGGSAAIISNYGSSYRSIKTAQPMVKRRNYVGSGIESEETKEDILTGGGEDGCLFCASPGAGGSGDGEEEGGGGGSKTNRFWQQVIPQ